MPILSDGTIDGIFIEPTLKDAVHLAKLLVQDHNLRSLYEEGTDTFIIFSSYGYTHSDVAHMFKLKWCDDMIFKKDGGIISGHCYEYYKRRPQTLEDMLPKRIAPVIRKMYLLIGIDTFYLAEE